MPLPDDSPSKWEYKEHTRVKHEILSKYLRAWIRVLGKFHNLNIFDCFAGRGRYQSGEEGSPIIIINALSSVRGMMSRPSKAYCLFIEKNTNNFENLEEELRKGSFQKIHEDWLNISCLNDEFSNIAADVINEYRQNLAPSFFFVDPFGFSGVPFEIIKELLSISKTEVFISFMIRDVNRFIESNHHKRSIEELYGVDEVLSRLSKKYPHLPQDRALLKFYRDRLHDDAKVKFTLPFQVNADERLLTTYYLIHCTNYPLGCEIMKEIMYKAGTEGRYGYFGPAEGQLSLHQFDNHGLKGLLLSRFGGKSILYKNLRHETLMETEAVKANYLTALRELKRDGKIHIEGQGPRGGIPDEAIIKFL